MFVHPKMHLKTLSESRMPSGRELFLRYGFVKPQHDGNSDPYKFTDPVNTHETQLEHLSGVKRGVIAVGRSVEARAAAEEAARLKEASESPAGTKDEGTK